MHLRRQAKIQLAIGLAGHGDRKNFRGVLRGMIGDNVAIECDGPGGRTTYELPIADIEHAKLVPDWDAVMKGGSGARTHQASPAKPPKHKPKNKPNKSEHTPSSASKTDAQPTAPTHAAPGESMKEQG